MINAQFMTDSAVHIIIHGQVQGVFFRASAQARASELSLTGWVRNLSNGTVEVHAEGKRESLNLFIEWCRKGPSTSQVSKCDLDWINPQALRNFKIL